jgi:hypothetical protein
LIADTVDAVATAKLNAATVTRDEVRQLVRKVINDKFREEQFDQCDLTLRDLSLIQDAFVRTLEARFHHRVKYPEPAPKKRAGATTGELRTKGREMAASSASAPIQGAAERRDQTASTTGSGFSVKQTSPGGTSGVYRAVKSPEESASAAAAAEARRRANDSQAIEPDEEEKRFLRRGEGEEGAARQGLTCGGRRA